MIKETKVNEEKIVKPKNHIRTYTKHKPLVFSNKNTSIYQPPNSPFMILNDDDDYQIQEENESLYSLTPRENDDLDSLNIVSFVTQRITISFDRLNQINKFEPKIIELDRSLSTEENKETTQDPSQPKKYQFKIKK